MKLCDVGGCGKKARTPGAAYCDMHYSRLRRHGHLEETRPFNRTTGECPVDDCGRPQEYAGMCGKHARRVERHGDPSVCIPQAKRALPRGEDHHQWAGDEVTYHGMHIRLRKTKGRAAEFACVDCGNQAGQWSYDHADPDERQSAYGAYSTDLDHYQPRCVPCHKRMDLAVLAAA